MAVVINGDTGIEIDGKDFYIQSNILGTVSQSSGVPTGAIIERGSNANGEYVKYADGTLICTKRDTALDSGTKVATWASSFVSTEYEVSGSVLGSQTTTTISVKFGAFTTSSVEFVQVAVSVYNPGETSLIAIGRWY